jgi:hypothetical protein
MTLASTPRGKSTTFWLHFRGKAIDKQYVAILIIKKKKVQPLPNIGFQFKIVFNFQH